MSNEQYRGKRSRKAIIGIFGFTLLVQFGLMAISFPLSDIFTDKPLFYSDAGYHWYQMKLATNLAQSSKIVGYDPYFNAGYPGGFTYDPSARGAMLMGMFFHPWLNEVKMYKLFAFLSALIAPLCVFVALWMLDFDSLLIGIGTTMGFLLWWTSLFRWYHAAGMVAFVLCAYLTLPYLVLVFKYVSGRGNSLVIAGLSIAAALGFLYHPFFPVPIAIGVAGYAVLGWKSVKWKRLFGLSAVAGLIAVAANLFWLLPTRHYAVLQEFRGFYQSIVDPNMVWLEFLGRWTGHAQGSKEYAILALTALWGLFYIKQESEKGLVRALVVSAVFLIVFAAVGGYFQVFARTLQPNRFAPVGYLYLLIPSTYGLREVIGRVRQPLPAISRLLAAATLAIVIMDVAYLANEARREVSFDDTPHYGARPPEVKGLGEYSNWVLSWLAHTPTGDGRVLFELSKARIYDGSRMAGYYAYQSGREFIGGPYPYLYFASFWDGWLFDKPIGAIDHEQFERYLDLYNVGWVLVHSEESKKYFDNYPGAVMTGAFKQLKGYSFQRPATYFMEGAGRVKQREHNNLVLTDLSGSEVLLKYHFIDGLKSDPPVTLVPVRLMDDPTPFIKIVNPPKEVRLFLP